jgi:hypothetical protein
MSDPMRASLRPDPVITMTAAPPLAHRTPVGVAWTLEDAAMFFNEITVPDFLILCVKVPMCKYCNNVAEAAAFFKDECWR